MKKSIIVLLLVFSVFIVNSQTTKDFFKSNDVKITWLGIDYSHVKIVGGFNLLGNDGVKNENQIKNMYFPAWNNLIIDESSKYDVNKIKQNLLHIYL